LSALLDHPEIAPDNNGSERALPPTVTDRKVTGGFRSTWGADLYAAVRSTVSTAARQGSHAFNSVRNALKRAAA
jgi:transposase